ncbi:hypothetical protein Cni_G05800 [Canna indica]|uniref:Uncharacterized protein n=1 Tax=Canna indica TaxID=4628 RepID=A0AAQ3JVU6_9LILI|nr:hypothetical protein Cni_G05800 [Canna indica]
MGSLQDTAAENNFMCPPSLLDPEEFRRQAHKMVDFIAEYYHNIDKYPVLSQVSPGYLRDLLPDSAPAAAEPLEAILHDVHEHLIPGLTH